jgi:hypothetical protein
MHLPIFIVVLEYAPPSMPGIGPILSSSVTCASSASTCLSWLEELCAEAVMVKSGFSESPGVRLENFCGMILCPNLWI